MASEQTNMHYQFWTGSNVHAGQDYWMFDLQQTCQVGNNQFLCHFIIIFDSKKGFAAVGVQNR
jgi:hypothetical protein